MNAYLLRITQSYDGLKVEWYRTEFDELSTEPVWTVLVGSIPVREALLRAAYASVDSAEPWLPKFLDAGRDGPNLRLDWWIYAGNEENALSVVPAQIIEMAAGTASEAV